MVFIGPVTEPTDGLVYDSSNINLKIGNRIIGRGKLYLSHNFLSWQGENMETGLNIHWKEIPVHGVTNPEKNIFFIMDKKLIWRGVYGDDANNLNGHSNEAMDTEGNNSDENDDEGDNECEEEEMTELTLISEDPNVAQQIYLAMTELQALHPDTDDSNGAEEEDEMAGDNGDDDDDEDSGFELEQVGRSDDTTDGAQNGMRNLNIGDPRFEDADE